MTIEGVSRHTLVGYQHTVTLGVVGRKLPGTTMSFSRGMPDNTVNILGQQGFFEAYPIKFTYRTKEIDIMLGSHRHS